VRPSRVSVGNGVNGLLCSAWFAGEDMLGSGMVSMYG